MKKLLLIALTVLSSNLIFAQSVGIGTNNPNSKSILELSSTKQGFLPPRMKTSEKTGLGLTAADYGMIVYDIDLNDFYFWDGGAWNTFGGADTDWTTNGSHIYSGNTGNVGIGITAPSAGLHINKGSDAALTDGSGHFIIGSEAGSNIVMDVNEIMARNNGAEAPLFMQNDGGDFSIHGVQKGGTEFIVLDNGRVGVGTSTPNGNLQFSQAHTNRKIVLYEGQNNNHQYYGFGATASELRYQVDQYDADHVFYAASQSTPSTTSKELMRIEGSGKVGIGGIDPTTTLDIIAPFGSADNIVKIGETGTTDKLKLSSGNTAYTFGGGNGSVVRHDITVEHATGNVGVGLGSVLTPNEKLTVDGVLSLKEITTSPALTSGYGKIYPKSDTKLYYRASDGSEHDLTAGGSDGDGIYDGNGSLSVQPTIVNYAGNNLAFNQGSAQTYVSLSTGGGNWIFQTDGANRSYFYNDGDVNLSSSLYTDYANRRVGVGTASPNSKFTVSGDESSLNGFNSAIQISNTATGGGDWFMRTGATGTSTPAGGFSIADNTAYRLSIDANGNVGIGDNLVAPGAKLEVDGQVKITGGNPLNGALLTSDASGLASWKPKVWAFNGFQTTSQGLTNGTQIVCNKVTFDDNALGGASAFSVIEIPYDGVYHFNASVYINTTGSPTGISFVSAIIGSFGGAAISGNNNESAAAGITIRLEKGDQITLEAMGDGNTIGSLVEFSGHLVYAD